MAEISVDWAKMEGEYVNSTVSLREIAAKYGVPLGNVQKHSAKCKWSEKRKKYAEKKAQRVSERLSEKDVKQTVRDIDRCCKAAGRLIDKINTAINQLDKAVYVSLDDIEQEVTERDEDGTAYVHTVKKRKMKTKQHKTLVDTKRLSELAKSLVNVKAVLTGDNGKAEDNGNSGVIEIAAAVALDPREEEEA